MKKEIYKKTFDERKKIKNVSVTDGIFTITFKDESTFSVEAYHSQDCCESVYADFGAVKGALEALRGYLHEIVIKSVSEMGVLFNFGSEKIFVPCYNSQNGYYSSSLELIIKDGDTESKIDISDSVDDDIE